LINSPYNVSVIFVTVLVLGQAPQVVVPKVEGLVVGVFNAKQGSAVFVHGVKVNLAGYDGVDALVLSPMCEQSFN